MNTKQDDGGPAFPVAADVNPDGNQSGMRLRDWFAGMALQGSLAAPHTAAIMAAFHKAGKDVGAEVAEMSYEIADAMLAAREEKP